MSTRPKIEFAQASDPGRDPNKQVNEDSCGYAETRFGHLAVLCDGMGGHYGGREASRTAITTIFETFEAMPTSMLPSHALKAAIEEAGRRVYLLGGPPDNRARPGSTVVAMLVHDKGLDVAHVGDSRAYIIRSNQIYPLTRDHSMVQGMIDAGMLTEETAMGHPDSNKITRALGMKPEVEVELRPEVMEIYPGDILLQSSDGLTDLALGREILGATRQALASGGVEHACGMLVKMANERGGHDNITVQMVRVTDVAPKTATTIPERADGAAPRAQPATLGAAQQSGTPATMPMQVTSPDGTPANLAYGQAAAGHDGGRPPMPPGPAGAAPHPAPAPTAPWSLASMPVQETTQYAAPLPGYTPAPAPVAPAAPQAMTPSPAAPAPVPETPAWTNASAASYGPSPQAQTPPPGLAAYRIDAGPAALPLPPPSQRVYTPPAPTPPDGAPQHPGYAGYGATPHPPMASGSLTPEPGGFAPPAALGAGRMMPSQPPSRGGVVFIIIGLSAVIAVLIIVVLWLSLR